MKKPYVVQVLVFLLSLGVPLSPTELYAQSNTWATAYYAGWMQGWTNNGHLPAQEIDYTAMTHIVHFALIPNADGTLNSDANSITATNSAELLSRAHAAGRKVLISVGGWGSDTAFRGATNSTNRGTFINNLINFMTARGYDGIDVDWEVLQATDGPQYTAFVTALRTALNTLTPRPLLTAASAGQPAIFAQVSSQFDQINIMTYDLSGAWPGWVTWHNAPIYDGGVRFPSTGALVPSANGMVDQFLALGVPASQLGIGLDFYGYVWSGGDGTPTGGATAPNQGWTTAPTVQDNVPYYTIMQSYYQSQYVRWDTNAQAAYLSIDNPGSANDRFISYDHETTCQKKVDYVRTKGLGGIIIWELGGGYRADQPAGQRDPLLQAVKQALGATSPPPPTDTTPPTVTLTAPTNGSTVSGTMTLSASATDNVSVVGVQFTVDGTNVGSELTAAPYTTSWNTNQASNGSHVVAAIARDAAGNRSTATSTVTVSNAPLVSTTDQWVYQDAVQPPWVNASWSAAITWTSTEQRYAGTAAIKVAQNAWGALSLHSGTWSAPVAVDPTKYQSVEFAIHGGSTGITLGVLLENDLGNSFPRVTYGTIPANQWVVVSIPLSQLDPNKYVIHRLDILELSGASRTYYVDQIRFVGTTQLVSLVAPTLASPTNGATGVATNPTLSWNAVTGAASYRVQVSTSSSFSSTLIDQSGLTATSSTASGLTNNTTYYWRVNATNAGGTSPWSSTWSFTTVSNVPSGTTADQWVYQEALQSPWINTSWSATVTMGSTEQVYAGTSAIKVVQNAWGALSVHSGAWGASVSLNPSQYPRVEFAIHGGPVGLTLGVLLENDLGEAFPRVTYGTIPANQWVVVSLPMSQLNPANRLIHRLDIFDRSGTKRTYYLDQLRFVGVSKLSKTAVPRGFTLRQNYPNPFNPSTTIQYVLPQDAKVTLVVYNILGQQMAVLVDEEQQAGSHEVLFQNASLPSGVYLYRLSARPIGGEPAEAFVETRKMQLLK